MQKLLHWNRAEIFMYFLIKNGLYYAMESFKLAWKSEFWRCFVPKYVLYLKENPTLVALFSALLGWGYEIPEIFQKPSYQVLLQDITINQNTFKYTEEKEKIRTTMTT